MILFIMLKRHMWVVQILKLIFTLSRYTAWSFCWPSFRVFKMMVSVKVITWLKAWWYNNNRTFTRCEFLVSIIWSHLWQNSTVAHGVLCVIYQEHVNSNCFPVFTEVVKKQGGRGRFSLGKSMVRIRTFLDNLIIKKFTFRTCSST